MSDSETSSAFSNYPNSIWCPFTTDHLQVHKIKQSADLTVNFTVLVQKELMYFQNRGKLKTFF